MSTISTTASADLSASPGMRYVFRVAGTLVALFQDNSLGPSYAVSTDSGATWAHHHLPGLPFSIGVITGQGHDLSAGFASAVIGSDLHIWFLTDSGNIASLYVASGWTGATFASSSVKNYPISFGGAVVAAASYAAGLWFVTTGNALASGAGAFATLVAVTGAEPLGVGGTTRPTGFWSDTLSRSGYGGVGIVATSGSTLTFTYADSGLGKTFLKLVTYSAGTFSVPTFAEDTGLPSVIHYLQPDASGNIDLFWESGQLLTRKRQLGSYGAILPLGYPISATDWSTSFDPSTNNAAVFFPTAVNVVPGEIYEVPRTLGWDTPIRLAGGGGGGYFGARASQFISGGVTDVTFHSDATTRSYVSASVVAGPSTPSNLTPAGDEASLTPTLSWSSNLPATNPSTAFEVIVFDALGAALWDHTVVSSATSVLYAGTALTYDAPVSWQVRDKDTLGNGGAGAWSSFSPLATFTPRQPGSVTITSVSHELAVTDTSPPSALASPSLSLDSSWTQAQGHDARAWQAFIYDSAGTTLVDKSALTLLSPVLASGGSFGTPRMTFTKLVTGMTYQLVFAFTDAVSGLVNPSAQWELNTAFPPPAPPSGFTATPLDDEQYVLLVWSSASDQTVTAYTRPTGTTDWTALAGDTSGGSLAVWAKINVAMDYEIIGATATGVTTAPAEQDDVTLGPAFGLYAVSLTDPVDPFNLTVPLGVIKDYSSTTAMARADESTDFRPQGTQTEKHFFSPKRQFSVQGRSYKIPRVNRKGDGTIVLGKTWRDLLLQMNDNHRPLLLRDDEGNSDYVVIRNSNCRERDSLVMGIFTCDFDSTTNVGFLQQYPASGTPLGGFLSGFDATPGISLPGMITPGGAAL